MNRESSLPLSVLFPFHFLILRSNRNMLPSLMAFFLVSQNRFDIFEGDDGIISEHEGFLYISIEKLYRVFIGHANKCA